VQNTRLWQRMLGLGRCVIERIFFDEDADVVVVCVRPRKRTKGRCGRCALRASRYDNGGGRRRWRALDLGTLRVFVEADAPRVRCPRHGPTVAEVPWARHGAGHTRDFDDTAAWLAVHCSKAAVVESMRIAWRTVGAIVARVCADIDATVDRFEGLARLGIDEISYKRGHRYLTVVIDHDSGRLVWAAPGRTEAVLSGFFEALGPARCGAITHVSADSAAWIERVVSRYCPGAIQCADAFHVVAWATDALDQVRRQVWNEARGGRGPTPGSVRRAAYPRRAAAVQRARWALWKNPEHLSQHQQAQLDWITTTSPRLWRAYLLKEGLRTVFVVKGDAGKEALEHWLAWAARCRLEPFVELARRIRRHRQSIEATLEVGLSNARTESLNTKLRLMTRVAFGFHGPAPLIALATLAFGGHRPTLPGRA
jgi:transposase